MARKFDGPIADAYLNELTSVITFHENASIDVLVEYVKHKKIRGSDSFFGYLADKLQCKIVSFDKDLVSKTSGQLLKA